MNNNQKYRNQEQTAPHSGKLLLAYFKEKRIRKSALARLMNCRPDTVYGFEKNSSIQTAILWELSHALQHNFFADIAALLPETYTTDAPQDQTNTNRIAELELQLKLLEAEKAILLEVLKK